MNTQQKQAVVPGELIRCQDFNAMSHCYTETKQQFASHTLRPRSSHCRVRLPRILMLRIWSALAALARATHPLLQLLEK